MHSIFIIRIFLKLFEDLLYAWTSTHFYIKISKCLNTIFGELFEVLCISNTNFCDVK